MQLQLGGALDKFGPKRVVLVFLSLAVFGCAAFAVERSFLGLIVSRALIGMGVSACLMALMTRFRHNFSATAQMRANSWMLMAGSLGMLASTIPVQWLLPTWGWRGLFIGLAAMFAVAMLLITTFVSADADSVSGAEAVRGAPSRGGYAELFRHTTFIRFAPMGFFHYGGLVAVQSLWAGPWLSQVVGLNAADTAVGMFGINLSMLVSFWLWGVWVPRLYATGWTAQSLIQRGVPLSLAVLIAAIAFGRHAGAIAWPVFCAASTFVSLSQPAVAQAFPQSLAGRALPAYNLIIFLGIVVTQWGMGLVIDALKDAGWRTESAFQAAFALLAAACCFAYLWFLRGHVVPGAAHRQ